MKKTIIAITIFSIILSVLSINVSAEQIEDLSGGQLLKQYVLEDTVVDEVITSTELTAEDKASINAAYLQSYIDSNETAKQTYGGRYIGDDGKLHVLFTEEVQRNVINSVNQMTENEVVYETSEYTLDELMALKEQVSDFWGNNTNMLSKKTMGDVVSVGVNEKNNSVIVSIKNCTQEKIDLFKTYVSNSDAIECENSNGYEFTTTTMYAGSKIKIGTSNYSMGFRCKSLNSAGNYNYGFITAAHGNSRGDSVYYNDDFIGTILKRTFANNSSLDAAFVYIADSNYIASNELLDGKGTLVSGAYMTNYAVNQTVGLSGAVTRYSTGKITLSSVDINMGDGTKLKDVVRASYKSVNGDSGGVVYVINGSSKYVSGITAMAVEDDANTSFYVKVTNIRSGLEINLY